MLVIGPSMDLTSAKPLQAMFKSAPSITLVTPVT
ncbi:hypothetical protein YPPY52_2592, partial [Yersinia pestis PY-52]